MQFFACNLSSRSNCAIRGMKLLRTLRILQTSRFFLKQGGRPIGYVLAVPQDLAVEDMKEDDPLMRADPARMYIDQVAVMPEERRGLAFLHLGYALLEEMARRGLKKVSSHLLISNGVNLIIGKIFGPMSTERRIVYMPKYGDDPFEYMEVTYANA